MTWEQAIARANALAARTGRRRRVVRCRSSIANLCPCGEWWVDPAGQTRELFAGWTRLS